MTQDRSATVYPEVCSRFGTTLRIGAALISCGFLLAACGSSGSSAAGPTPSSAAAAQSSANAASPVSPPSSAAAASTGAIAGAGADVSFCKDAKLQQAQQTAALKALTTDSPQQLEAFENQALAALTTLTSSAPAAIKSDVAVIVAADQKLFAALKAANFNYTKLNPTTLSSLDGSALANASKGIAAYLTTKCGIKPTP